MKEGEAPEGYFVIVVGIMQHIIVMPPQLIIIGVPAAIMFIIPWQHCINMSFMASFMGSMVQVIAPAGVIVQVILHIIIGIVMPGIPPIIPIIGIIMGFSIAGVMPVIIGIIGCIAGFIVVSVVFRRICSIGLCFEYYLLESAASSE